MINISIDGVDIVIAVLVIVWGWIMITALKE